MADEEKKSLNRDWLDILGDLSPEDRAALAEGEEGGKPLLPDPPPRKKRRRKHRDPFYRGLPPRKKGRRGR